MDYVSGVFESWGELVELDGEGGRQYMGSFDDWSCFHQWGEMASSNMSKNTERMMQIAPTHPNLLPPAIIWSVLQLASGIQIFKIIS